MTIAKSTGRFPRAGGHPRQTVRREQIDPIANPCHQLAGGRSIVFGNPLKNALKVILRGIAEDDLHMP